ncbi:Protein NLP3 [Ananas comosus]|uniref:Protein NLP3 n=1 Tax=Ananas comosus TaxID=4615 RepID=A0A199W4Y8_ANACO|nr:Protein NLP3 [Ananas comosus]
MESPPSPRPLPPPPPPPPLPRWCFLLRSMPGRDEEAAEARGALMDLDDLDLDLDLDLDPDPPPPPPPPPPPRPAADDAEWPFDALVSPSLLSSSSPPQSLLHLSFPSPPSPLCLFEDRPFDASTSIAELALYNPDTVSRNINGTNDKRRPLQLLVEEDNADHTYIIKERMTQALRQFKESTDQHLLVQVWAPVKNGDRYVLTTSGQPFVLDHQSVALLQYRTVSLTYMFSVDGDNDGELGLPGRVYRQKVPEWTPNVQYYSSKEYPRLCHALNYNVRGTVALPVFYPSAHTCVAVIELIMTSQKINYAGEVGKVCKALEAVNLKSTEIQDHPSVQICNKGRQTALAEILETLAVVCEDHKLPLAQTWVPCRHRSVLAHGGGLRKSCSSFDGSCMGQVCMSTSDVAFHVIDAHIWRFRDACVEHHLQKGQGVAGIAFESRRPCFSEDITQFSKTQYPLVHYSRMCGLAGCFAVCLQSTFTGNDDYILEFFLPPECKNAGEQRVLLEAMIISMKRCFRSLKVVADVELQEGITLQSIDMLVIDNREFASGHPRASLECNFDKGFNGAGKLDNRVSDMPEKHILANGNAVNNGIVIEQNGSGTSSSSLANKNNKPSERRRGKAEKTISLEVLQQYFAGSLKNAAKSLGVCPTTMKRICRQHGILRWPSRKINKVNRSLSKLKQVIESVDGAFTLPSLPCPLPVAVGSLPSPSNVDKTNKTKESEPLKPFTLHTERENKLSTRDTSPDNDGSGKKLFPHCSRSGSSSEEGSSNTHTSEGSCHASPQNENVVSGPFNSTFLGPELKPSCTLGLINPNTNFICLNTTAVEPQSPLNGMLVEDSGSSKYLKNLCPCAVEIPHDEHNVGPTSNNPTSMANSRVVTIKASYKDDIVRFRFTVAGNVTELKDEIAKRLKLEVGMFDVKYLDDDPEWVLLACNADLEECVEIARLSGRHVVRLLVSDISASLGSSCESSRG